MARKLTRHIKDSVQILLWGRAAGRCEFAGCNKPLYESSVTKEEANIGQKGHIYSFSEDGPRGHGDLKDEEINDTPNLILVCHQCHQIIDRDKDGTKYTAELLQTMKRAHEERVELVTGISPGHHSWIVGYGSNIGDAPPPPTFDAAANALFASGRHPAARPEIRLGMTGSRTQDHDQHYWAAEEHQLTHAFAADVAPRLRSQEIDHLSIFAIAPQPLLILLGTLLTDIPAVDVYQLHRDPKTWDWLKHPGPLQLRVEEPKEIMGPPAIVFAISATVNDDRILQAMNKDVTIWRVTIPEPDNDILRSCEQLEEFRRLIRPLMDRIKAAHGQRTLLNVFPAMPVAMAVELGRARQPKADMPWKVYDQVNKLGGFIPAIEILKESKNV